MYFPKLLAVASTLAPVVYGYAIATVDVTTHENCPVGQWPVAGTLQSSTRTTATEGTCSSVHLKHKFSIDSYSFGSNLLTPDAEGCVGVGFFDNKDCDGEPSYFLPYDGKPHVQSPCLSDIKWEKNLSVKLICPHKETHKGF